LSPLLSCLVFGCFSLVFWDLCAMVAGGLYGGRCVCRVDLGLRVGNLGDSGLSLNGSLGAWVGPRCVGDGKLGDLGVFRWVLGSNSHFLWVFCRFAMCVGWVLGIIVLSGGGCCLAGFLAVFIFVVLCIRHRTTLFVSVCLVMFSSIVMLSSRVCLMWRGGWRYLVIMPLSLSWLATPPIRICPST
jgi:hypothetical protein